MLFLIFINDLTNTSDKFKYTLFADDSTLSYSFDPRCELLESHAVINSELSKIHNWLSINRIKVNVDKTNYVLFNYRMAIDFPTIAIGGEEVSRVDRVKFLGVIFDENLKFGDHVNYIGCKISKTVGLLNRLKHCLPDKVLLSLYDSLITPYLTYCIEVWGSASTCYIDKIVKIQKSAIRSVNNLSFNSHTSPYFGRLNILKFSQLFEYRILLLMYKAIFFNSNSCLFFNFSRHRDVHLYFTRGSTNLIIPHFLKTKTRMSISFIGPKLWNALPDLIKMSRTFSIFKRTLKYHMVQTY